MKNNFRKKIISLDSQPNLKLRGSESSARLPSDYSPPTLAVEGSEEYFGAISFDVQVTVRSKLDLTRKQLCMLTGIALSDVAEKGLGLSDWMVLEWLYSSLLGNKQTPYERKDPKEFELSLLCKIVLLSGTWMGLEGKVKLPQDTQELILNSRFVPKGRTKASWRQSWNIAKFIEIRAVPLDVLLERSKGTNRYSSYCKGYGESSRLGRRQKTRPSAELDGEPVDLEKDKMMNLDLQRISQLLTAVLLEIKYTNRS
jgi:hypothetical protein